MGAYSSTHLTPEEIEELVTQTNFHSKEIEQLYHRFKKLDRSRSGVISKQDFQLVSELTLNPMAPRILTLFHNDSNEDAIHAGGVTFDIFVRTLNFFNARTPLSTKLRTLFRAYDVDGDGRVSERDLTQMIKYYTGPHLTEATCKVMVRKTMEKARATLALSLHGKEKGSSAGKRNSPSAAANEESEAAGLTFEEFSRVVGEEGLEGMEVQVPLRHDE